MIGENRRCEVLLAAFLVSWMGSAQAYKFPATGQTTSYQAGDDGAIRAGGKLSYTDNGNGTITDKNTGLVWEKQSNDNSVHDVDNLYTWQEAFTVHVATLNNQCQNDDTLVCTSNANCSSVGGKCGFAGKRDWRVPNYKELVSILNLQNFDPSISPAFNTNCVNNATSLTGSCTAANDYWSSTSFVFATDAWFVNFLKGNVGSGPKSGQGKNHVRAVRGGLLMPLTRR